MHDITFEGQNQYDMTFEGHIYSPSPKAKEFIFN